MQIEPMTLEGTHVRLEPLEREHVEGLCAVGLDPEIWRWTQSQVGSPEQMRDYVETALRWQAERTALPFATVEKGTGAVAGSTRFGNIDRANRRVEIGWTWLGRRFQRTACNTEAKYLMLRHAFENWGCLRVEFKTDALNERSRAALLRIGAREEGTLRKHMITASGRVRDSVYFSVLDDEWPAVKKRLEERLGGR
jgi:RimJ/RimL family protein N-acetyltransferase